MLTNMNFLNMGEHSTVRLILLSTTLVVLMRILNFILWPAFKKKKKAENNPMSTTLSCIFL